MITKNTGIIYSLEDRPPFLKALCGGIQHVLASFVGVITPTLIIGGVLGLGSEIPYLISMALIVSGVATFIQARRIGPIGSGLLSVQGTSFAFLGSVLAAGFIAKSRGGGPDEILALIIGVCFLGAFVEIILSQFITHLRKIINPTVTGIVITVIGLSLIRVGIVDFAGGFGAENFGSFTNLALGGIVLIVILALTLLKNKTLQVSSVFIGMLVGYIVAIFLGVVDFSKLGSQELFAIPIPFKYGFAFDFAAFLPIAFIYLITAIESTGDLTATSMLSGEPVEGDTYIKRIKGGVLGDGVNSLITLSTSGTRDIPIPRPKETAMMMALRLSISWLAKIRIPAAAIDPNKTIVAPPKTGLGKVCITPPTIGNNPKITKIAATK